MKICLILFMILFGSSCRFTGNLLCADRASRPQIWISEHRVVVGIDGTEREAAPVEKMVVLRSEKFQAYFPEQEFIRLISSTDILHFANVSVLALETPFIYTLLQNDTQVATFLCSQMPSLTRADQIRDFLGLFAELRGYEIIEEKPVAQDARIGEDRKEIPDAGSFDLVIVEQPHGWRVNASLKTDPNYSGTVYRYTFFLPHTDRHNLRVNQRELQFIEHLIR